MPIHSFAAFEAKGELSPYDYEPKALGAHEVEISISHCGLCHSDLHLIDNDWNVTQYPLVPGHEIIGKITDIGSEVQGLSLGQRVGVGWQCDSCGTCEWCERGEENNCANAQPTCVMRHGGFADAVIVNARFAVPIPQALESTTAAPLLCGGVTVYSPLKRYIKKPGMKVAVLGIGGLGHMALQFAHAMGAKVTALSHTPEKEAEAKALGADAFVLTDKASLQQHLNEFDLILSTVSAGIDAMLFLDMLRPEGVLCMVGGPTEMVDVRVRKLITGRKSVSGSNIGSPSEIKEMLSMAAEKGIKAQVQVLPLEDVNQAIQTLRDNKARYRMVLEM